MSTSENRESASNKVNLRLGTTSVVLFRSAVLFKSSPRTRHTNSKTAVIWVESSSVCKMLVGGRISWQVGAWRRLITCEMEEYIYSTERLNGGNTTCHFHTFTRDQNNVVYILIHSLLDPFAGCCAIFERNHLTNANRSGSLMDPWSLMSQLGGMTVLGVSTGMKKSTVKSSERSHTMYTGINHFCKVQ